MESFPEGPPSSGVPAREQISAPAILLMVTGVLGAVASLFSVVRNASGMNQVPPNLANNPQFQQYIPLMQSLQSVGRFTSVLGILISGFVFYGALKMKNLQSYGLAMAAAIVSVIPCLGPCCCIGLPAGIWALVVLNKPEVRSAFRPS